MVDHLVEAFHVLANGRSFVAPGLSGFGSDSRAPDSVDRRPRFAAREVLSVVRCFPGTAILVASFGADSDKTCEDAEVAEFAILLWDKGCSDIVHLGRYPRGKLTGLPKRRDDDSSFLAQVADVPRMDAVVSRGLSRSAGEACFLDLGGREPWQGLATSWRETAWVIAGGAAGRLPDCLSSRKFCLQESLGGDSESAVD